MSFAKKMIDDRLELRLLQQEHDAETGEKVRRQLFGSSRVLYSKARMGFARLILGGEKFGTDVS